MRNSFRTRMPVSDVAKKSGVYFIADESKKILYIGKATTQNLEAEICSKFRTPTIVDKAADVPSFEKSPLAKWARDPRLQASVRAGEVLIFALVIEPAAVTSMVEVYLQTLCQVGPDRALPPLNKRIG